MGSQARNDRFFLYPRPTRGPDIPYKDERKSNPRIDGWFLAVAAVLMEWFGLLRYNAWKNAGFGSLRGIRDHIEDYEPRFDPAVFPLGGTGSGSEASGGRDNDHVVNRASDNPPAAPLSDGGKYSASDYRALYLSGELTPLDIAKTILPMVRRDTSPPGIHSMAWFDVKVDLVLKAAEESTLRYKEGRSLGPLDGVPTAVKDEYDMEGYMTTLGSVNDYVGREPHDGTIDTWCVRKLQDAGAVIVGKLSMHEYGLDTSGNNITFGTPRNPYHHQYYTGGSSSGPAYAVAAGLVPIAMGSDGGGSIRIPSAFCSVFGLKTTHDRLSFFPGQNHSKTCATNGPIAADMRSLAQLYSVVSEPHPTSHFPSPPGGANGHIVTDSNRPRVIGICEPWFQKATPAAQQLCRGMIAELVKEKGYKVVNIDIPFLVEGQMAHALTVLTDAATLLPDTRGVSPANRVMLALGRTTPSTDYLLAQKLRAVIMQHLAWLWEKHPGMVIATPTTSCAGWKIQGDGELKYGVSDGNQTLKTMEYVWMGNFCGLPSISVPAGFVVPEGEEDAGDVAEQGIPIGLMVTGEWTSEEELMQFGLDAEEAGRERQRNPPVWADVVKLAKERKVDEAM
ncbi:glutamyl-tRNA amidotransferase subunit A [Zalerion maritima]|uniref:Glutamyl-tRNA amidotransferase subunit A n=1 Tax=Zalerion maritima TaxID=339359 RepID=A0AAD5RML8_9PEZI|nr:glutamyl-tRNA amidotransferase subunit A [Zalerion maritima]